MRIALHEVSKGRAGQALPSMSLEFHSGAVRYALAETEQRPTVLGLIASGRMRPDTGRVTIDAAASPKELRRRIALVDAPDVSDPHPDITVAGVVGEELMFAGRGATPLHARRWLGRVGYQELASVPIGASPDGWWRIAAEFADRGYAMLVIVGGSAAVALERMHEFDAINASGPIEPLVLERPEPAADTPEESMVADGSATDDDAPDQGEPTTDEEGEAR